MYVCMYVLYKNTFDFKHENFLVLSSINSKFSKFTRKIRSLNQSIKLKKIEEKEKKSHLAFRNPSLIRKQTMEANLLVET